MFFLRVNQLWCYFFGQTSKNTPDQTNQLLKMVQKGKKKSKFADKPEQAIQKTNEANLSYTPQPLYNTVVGVQDNFRVSYPIRVITRVNI